MTKYNVGDKVFHKENGYGVIISICHDVALVEFKNFILRGHNGNGIGDIQGTYGHCWWFSLSTMDKYLVNDNYYEPSKPAYKPTRSMKEPELQSLYRGSSKCGGGGSKGIEAVKPTPMTRASILAEAAKIVTTDREQQYGSPEDNFSIIAEYWTIWLKSRLKDGESINAHDVAAMMAELKIARIQSGQVKADNYVDLAGYVACGAEIKSKESEQA